MTKLIYVIALGTLFSGGALAENTQTDSVQQESTTQVSEPDPTEMQMENTEAKEGSDSAAVDKKVDMPETNTSESEN